MIRVTDVAYARFSAPDLDRMEAFLCDFGLVRSARTKTTLYMRATDKDHHVHVTELGEPRFKGFAFNVNSEDDIHALSKTGGASEVHHMDEPGGGKRVSIADPDGFVIEVVHGMEELSPLPVENFFPANQGTSRQRQGEFVRLETGPAQCKRLGHVVLTVTDFKKTDAFYKSHFGLLSSDECHNDEGETVLSFNRCDRGGDWVDHHTLLTVPGEKAALGHIAFEVEDLNHLQLGHEHLKTKGYKHSWGIGRHIFGSQIFDYWFDPYDFRVEHWTDGDLLNATTPSGKHPIAEALNVQWGTDASSRLS